MHAVLDNLQLFVHTVLLAIGALLPIVDPLAGAPIFHELTSGADSRQRAATAKAVALDSFLLLLASTFVGAYVLDFFGLSIPAVQIAGGVVVCAMGWSLLNKPEMPDAASRASAAEAAEAADTVPRDFRRRAFYPLTMPLTVGPGSISVAITLGANPTPDVRSLLITAAGHAVGAFAIAISIYLCYRYADALVTKLGDTGRTVVTRLSAFLLLCIGVQIGWNGVHALLASTFPGAVAQ
jgi:multiple antibiotic resistance protein